MTGAGALQARISGSLGCMGTHLLGGATGQGLVAQHRALALQLLVLLLRLPDARLRLARLRCRKVDR